MKIWRKICCLLQVFGQVDEEFWLEQSAIWQRSKQSSTKWHQIDSYGYTNILSRYFIISLYQTIDIVPLHCPQVLLHCFSTLSSLQSYLLRNRHHGFVSLQSMPFTLSILLPVRCIDLDTSKTKRKKKIIDERRWISLMLKICSLNIWKYYLK